MTGWRLPNTDLACVDCISEMGHLYYVELGNKAWDDSGGGLTNTGPFTNLLPFFYWTGTEMGINIAWYFYFTTGAQNTMHKEDPGLAMAVRPGVRNLYVFSGFFSPVDNVPTVNTAKAGQAIPFKWKITDTSGVGISDPSSFAGLSSYPISCGNFSHDVADAVEEVASGNSGIQYLGDGYWQFNWKTPKTYSSPDQQCRVVVISLSDGGFHYSYFKFTK